MLALKFWSDRHQGTRLGVLVSGPFPFEEKLARSTREEVAPGLLAPVVTLDTPLEMKRGAARPQDRADIDELNLALGRPSSYDRPA